MPIPAPIQENPPYLVIRRGMAFWVTETHAPWRATAQALADGVFADTYLYTARGDLWQINTASPPTHAFFKSRLPWQKLSISLDFKRLPPAPLATVQADLAEILNSDQAFVNHLTADNQLSATEMLTWFTRAETPEALIATATLLADHKHIPERLIQVRSPHFVILTGEQEELVNPGMYGKALALYLQQKLPERGYKVSFFCCEDWGWWVQLENTPFRLGVCIYCGPPTQGLLNFFCCAGAPDRPWSWKHFRWLNPSSQIRALERDLIHLFSSDAEIEWRITDQVNVET